MSRILLVVISFNLLACQEKAKMLYYENGNLKAKIPLKQTYNHGIAEGYYENGKLEYMEHWQNGELNGFVTYFYNNENIKSETLWVGNRKNGLSKKYKENGKLWSLTQYENDKPEWVRLYYENGSMLEHQLYNDVEDLIYLAKYDTTGFKYIESPMPIIDVERDSILVGEEFKMKFSFDLSLNGKVMLYSGRLDQNNTLTDSSLVPNIGRNSFLYRLKPTQEGKRTIHFEFKHITNNDDSLSVDKLRHKKTLYVLPNERHSNNT